MANIHETLKEVRSIYAEVVKLQKEILASHREQKGHVEQVEAWHESADSLMSKVDTLRVWFKYLGGLSGALVFMIGTLGGLAGGALVLLLVWLTGSAD